MRARVDRVEFNDTPRLISMIGYGNLSDHERDIFSSCFFVSSHIWAGYADDEFVCTWGLAPPTLLSDQAYLWLYTNDRLKGKEFTFIRQSQIAMQEMLKYYPMIVGHCDPNAEQSKRWLRLLGARFGEPEGGRQPFMIKRRAA